MSGEYLELWVMNDGLGVGELLSGWLNLGFIVGLEFFQDFVHVFFGVGELGFADFDEQGCPFDLFR